MSGASSGSRSHCFLRFVYSGRSDSDWHFKAKEFLTGYLIELSLSIDNLFVFLLIFTLLQGPEKVSAPRAFLGHIHGARVMRMVMIFAGAELVERFHWILYIFGAFLIYTGIKMFGEDEAFRAARKARSSN